MEAYLGHIATKLQALRRGLVQERLFRHMRSSAVTIQAAWRCAAARRAFLRQRAAAICIQAHCRGLIVQRAYHAARVKYLTLEQIDRSEPPNWSLASAGLHICTASPLQGDAITCSEHLQQHELLTSAVVERLQSS